MEIKIKNSLPPWVIAATTSMLSQTAGALQIETSIEVPRLNVAEYHRPYVALWIENSQRQAVANLSVWYDINMANAEGETWLKDLRQWWRKSGRFLELPVDGVSAPTRPPGVHQLSFNSDETDFFNLPQGDYFFIVEAAREVGGREILTLPFYWNGEAIEPITAQGERELGSISFSIQKP